MFYYNKYVFYCTKWWSWLALMASWFNTLATYIGDGGWIGRAWASHAGDQEFGSRPRTYKVHTCHSLAYRSILLGQGKDWLGQFKILWLSEKSRHGAGGLIFLWGRTIKSQRVCTVTSLYPSWHDLRCCKDLKLKKTTSYGHIRRVYRLVSVSKHWWWLHTVPPVPWSDIPLSRIILVLMNAVISIILAMSCAVEIMASICA